MPAKGLLAQLAFRHPSQPNTHSGMMQSLKDALLALELVLDFNIVCHCEQPQRTT